MRTLWKRDFPSLSLKHQHMQELTFVYSLPEFAFIVTQSVTKSQASIWEKIQVRLKCFCQLLFISFGSLSYLLDWMCYETIGHGRDVRREIHCRSCYSNICCVEGRQLFHWWCLRALKFSLACGGQHVVIVFCCICVHASILHKQSCFCIWELSSCLRWNILKKRSRNVSCWGTLFLH